MCRSCGQEKALTEFYERKRKDGSVFHRQDCKVCQRAHQQAKRAENPESFRNYQRAYYADNTWRYRDSSLKKKYGITYADFQAMHAAQEGCCALCRRDLPEKGAHVDHDHETGKVRALLCHHCNTGIGNLQDDPDLLMAAALYVLQHKGVTVSG
jgi:hypothetical protein